MNAISESKMYRLIAGSLNLTYKPPPFPPITVQLGLLLEIASLLEIAALLRMRVSEIVTEFAV